MSWVKYTRKYENESGCKNFIFCTSEYLFEEDILKNLSWFIFWLFFVTVLLTKPLLKWKSSVIFTDPETSKPVIKVFERIALSQGQETATIKAAIKETFKMNSLESTIFKTVFLSPESALVNCSKNSDLIKKN